MLLTVQFEFCVTIAGLYHQSGIGIRNLFLMGKWEHGNWDCFGRAFLSSHSVRESHSNYAEWISGGTAVYVDTCSR